MQQSISKSMQQFILKIHFEIFEKGGKSMQQYIFKSMQQYILEKYATIYLN